MTPADSRLAVLSLAEGEPGEASALRIVVGKEVFAVPAMAVRMVLDQRSESTTGFLLGSGSSEQARAEAPRPRALCKRLKKTTIAETPAGASGFGHGLPSEYIELRCTQNPNQPCPDESTCVLREISKRGYRVVTMKKQTRPEVMRK